MIAGTIHPGLRELDSRDDMLNSIVSGLPVNERVEHFEKLIDRTQKTLLGNSRLLSHEQKEKLMELITSARQQILRLERGEL